MHIQVSPAWLLFQVTNTKLLAITLSEYFLVLSGEQPQNTDTVVNGGQCLETKYAGKALRRVSALVALCIRRLFTSRYNKILWGGSLYNLLSRPGRYSEIHNCS